jgi:hypothetical protein
VVLEPVWCISGGRVQSGVQEEEEEVVVVVMGRVQM